MNKTVLLRMALASVVTASIAMFILVYRIAVYLTVPSERFVEVVSVGDKSPYYFDLGYSNSEFIRYFSDSDTFLQKSMVIFKAGLYWNFTIYMTLYIFILLCIVVVGYRLYRSGSLGQK